MYYVSDGESGSSHYHDELCMLMKSVLDFSSVYFKGDIYKREHNFTIPNFCLPLAVT